MAAIVGWVTGKLAGPVFLAAAILFGGTAAVQTVRINGISIFGLYAVEGYKPLYEKAQAVGERCRADAAALDAGLERCNASIAGLAAQGRTATAEAQAAMAKLKAAQAGLSDARTRLSGVPGAGAVCPSVDAIFRGAFVQ